MINLKKLLTETDVKPSKKNKLNESRELTTLEFTSNGEKLRIKFQVYVNSKGTDIVFSPVSQDVNKIRTMEENGLDSIDIATLIAVRVNRVNKNFVQLEVNEKATDDFYYFNINLNDVLKKLKL